MYWKNLNSESNIDDIGRLFLVFLFVALEVKIIK